MNIFTFVFSLIMADYLTDYFGFKAIFLKLVLGTSAWIAFILLWFKVTGQNLLLGSQKPPISKPIRKYTPLDERYTGDNDEVPYVPWMGQREPKVYKNRSGQPIGFTNAQGESFDIRGIYIGRTSPDGTIYNKHGIPIGSVNSN